VHRIDGVHSFLLAALLAFPVPHTPRIPLSAPRITNAAGDQVLPQLAWNGTIGLAAWTDSRDPENPLGNGFATRLDADGNALDPLGINLGDGYPRAVAWDGGEFVVIEDDAFVFVSAEGAVLGRKAIDRQPVPRFGAVTTEGPLRVLFLAADGVRIYDARGELAAVGRGEPTNSAVASRGREFLVLHGDAADRIDADSGALLGAAGTGLNVSDFDAAAGGPDGYLLVRRQGDALHLDTRGVPQGSALSLIGPAVLGPRVIHTANGYRAVFFNNGAVYLAEFLDSGAALTLLFGFGGNPAIAENLVVMQQSGDIVAQRIGGAPHLITTAATAQSDVATVAGANGWLVAWLESGKVLARRFPQDEAPIELGASSTPPRVVSNGDTYLVTWADSSTLRGRRMDARSGAWIDAAPFSFAAAPDFALGTNGRDALVAWNGTSLHTRRINLVGDPLASAEMTAPTDAFVYDLTIGSNGDDYLVAWSDGQRFCPILCPISPFRILALHTRADGAPLDAAPIVIEDARTYPQRPSIAWTGTRYLLVWSDFSHIAGRYLGDPGPAAVLETTPSSDVEGRALAFGDRMLLLFRTGSHWTGVAIANDAPLDEVASLPRSSVADRKDFAAATRGDEMLVAFTPLDAALGFVPRAVVQIFGEPTRRRPAVR
jgi:hypothetical protein